MKKIFVLVLCSSLMLSSCGTYTGSGAYAGASLGSILGSAIGGLSGGPRGSDMGTIIGMAGGAAVGAVLGSQADQAQAQRQSTYPESRSRHSQGVDYSDRSYEGASTPNDSQIFDSSNSGDDRIYDFDGKDYTGNYSAQQPTSSMPSAKIDELGGNFSYSPSLEILNARFVDANEDNTLNRNETCKLIFEVRNSGKQAVYDVVPTVVETTGNKHIFISPSVHVEKIEPGNTIRYTAMVKADNRLKDGVARFCVSVIQGGKSISKVNQFDIPTKR
ncbi:MAG TPA: hypothetical protein DDW28_03755 [Prevotella sp.]|nr:hypothetical protein [uncultured Prevotella sp.]HBF05233.1 hypothetical protein [Candidatus Segatella violae]